VSIKAVATVVGLAGWLLAGDAGAQGARGVAVEGSGGWVGFVDDATIEHVAIGASARLPIGERLSVGPEVVFTTGPGAQRNLFVLGSLWFDLVRATPATRVVPYVVAGGGYQRHRDVVAFSSGEGSFTAGGGVRVPLGERAYVGGDVRVGWELHLRTAVVAGVTWPR
jgi:hypothetical protein